MGRLAGRFCWCMLVLASCGLTALVFLRSDLQAVPADRSQPAWSATDVPAAVAALLETKRFASMDMITIPGVTPNAAEAAKAIKAFKVPAVPGGTPPKVAFKAPKTAAPPEFFAIKVFDPERPKKILVTSSKLAKLTQRIEEAKRASASETIKKVAVGDIVGTDLESRGEPVDPRSSLFKKRIQIKRGVPTSFTIRELGHPGNPAGQE